MTDYADPLLATRQPDLDAAIQGLCSESASSPRWRYPAGRVPPLPVPEDDLPHTAIPFDETGDQPCALMTLAGLLVAFLMLLASPLTRRQNPTKGRQL